MFLHASILKMSSIQCICFWMGLLLAQFAKASPLLNTDDAGIVPKKHCQLEAAVVSSHQDPTATQMDAACQIMTGVESSVIYSTTDFGSEADAWAAELKTVLHSNARWGVASSLTVTHHEDHSSHPQEWFANLPFTWTSLNNRLQLLANVGYQHTAEDPNLWRWGLAASYALTDKTSLSVETYNQDRQAPFAQTALEYALIPNLLSLEASFGQRLDAFRQRWFGFGLSFTP